MRAVPFFACLSAIMASPALAGPLLFKPIVEARLRLETVDQDGPAPITKDRDASALTLRLRAGGEVASGHFALLAETEGTLALDRRYNSGVNGRTAYPIVPDPETVELNRVQLQYRTRPLVLTLGRQRINLDDQRFVGSVAWRQNEQTFDAARIEYMGIPHLRIDVTYAIAAQTIWGMDGGRFGAANRPTRIEGSNVFATAAYTTSLGTLTGLAFIVDQDEPVAALQRNSSQTWGLRFTGARPLGTTAKLSYLASYARQSDHANNPVRYRADYAAAELALDIARVRVTAGYERLGSDAGATGVAGGHAFQTPFATLHKFNGWADKFLTTPGTGLQDSYAGIGVTLPRLGKTGPLNAVFTYHRFDGDRAAIHYGDEYNAQLTLKLDKRLSLLVKYADYRRTGLPSFTGDADTRKVWAQIDFAM